ncbi:hypothetical protein SBRCBS47491_006156 [Sporothrix bragantina]|uniref:Uncharacterized protein n=1 Tax=Sporothrix bragantina TaxID=671064 RepID=A0ABP0C2L7_9PEZI
MDEMATSRDISTLGQTLAVLVPTPTDDPELYYPFYHQRGRRRRRSPVPASPYDDVSVPYALTMTPTTTGSPSRQRPQNHPRVPPRPKNRPRPRQETPSGSAGTFRGRRRHRSPSMGPTSSFSAATAAAAIRKASTRPHTRSSSVASSMRHLSSRPSSPHEWPGPAAVNNDWMCRSISRSRGRRGPGAVGSNGNGTGISKRGPDSSPSPRRRVASFRASMDVDHGMGHHYAASYDYSHHHLLVQARHYNNNNNNVNNKPMSRRSHCPSRSGSAEGYHHEEDASAIVDPIAMASRRRRRRQRTQSRPRPRRNLTGDDMSSATDVNGDVFGVTGYYTFYNSSAAHSSTASHEPKSHDAGTRSSRLQYQMMLGESSDTTSDGNAMDVEME